MLIEIKDKDGNPFLVNPQLIAGTDPILNEDNIKITFGGISKVITMEMFFYLKSMDGLGASVIEFSPAQFEIAKQYRNTSTAFPKPVPSIDISVDRTVIMVGESFHIDFEEAYLKDPVLFSSLPEGTINVDENGNVIGLAEGLSVVTLTSGETTDTITIEVDPVILPVITPAVDEYIMVVGDTVVIDYTSENIISDIEVTVRNTSVAQININGKLEAVSEGITELVLTTGTLEVTVPITVAVV